MRGINFGEARIALLTIAVSAITSSVCAWLVTKNQCTYFLRTVDKYVDWTMERIIEIVRKTRR
nr:MAG TPA: hypothetical protein [Caudoviricetes sp.]